MRLPDPLALEASDPKAVARFRFAGAVVLAIYALGVLAFAFLHGGSSPPQPVASAPILIDLPPAQPKAPPQPTPKNIPDLAPNEGQEMQSETSQAVPTPSPLDKPDTPAPMPQKAAPASSPKSNAGADDGEAKAPVPSTSTPVDAPQLKSSESTTILSFTRQAQANALEDWHARLDSYLERFKQYPPDARRRHETGTVMLHFVVDRKGRVLTYDIAESSGSPALDQAALDMIERADPLPPMPEEMLELQSDFVIGVEFNIK